MNVTQLTTCDEGLTNPKRSRFGVTIALRGGNVRHPVGKGKWFEPPYFQRVVKFYLPVEIGIAIAVLWLNVIAACCLMWFGPWGILSAPLFWLNPCLWTSWNLFGWKGYFGAKIYGVDSEAYLNWPNTTPDEVYSGSLALHYSARLSIND